MSGFNIGRVDLAVALGVILATAATDAVYVMFTASVAARRAVRPRPGAVFGICSRPSR